MRNIFDIIEACYEQLGEPAVYRVKGEDSYLEGGDYIPFGTISLIGQGLRTNQKAIDELLENNCFGHDTVVVVRERWKDQYQMHLDTYFNVIDKDLCTMCFNRYDARDISDINYLTMDMYVRSPGQSKDLEAEYAKYGVRVEWVPLDNLIGGYGAAHCMTQVLNRGK